MKNFSVLVCLLSVLAGCQQNPIKTDCVNRDWQEVGVIDGMAGLDAGTALEFSTSRCGNAGGSVNREAYLAGHSEGLLTFCTADNGNRLALNGVTRQDICPSGLAKAFRNGFDQGIKDLCTPSGGKLLATRTRRYEGACPENIQTEFLQNYLAELDQLAVSARTRFLAAEAEIGEHAISIRKLSSTINNEIQDLENKRTAAENRLEEARGILALAEQMREKWGS